MGLNVLGNQSHLLQRCHPACGHEESSKLSPLLAYDFLSEMAIFHTGGVFSYLPHHLDLALEDSVGHSTCMSVLARRRAIVGWLVG